MTSTSAVPSFAVSHKAGPCHDVLCCAAVLCCLVVEPCCVKLSYDVLCCAHLWSSRAAAARPLLARGKPAPEGPCIQPRVRLRQEHQSTTHAAAHIGITLETRWPWQGRVTSCKTQPLWGQRHACAAGLCWSLHAATFTPSIRCYSLLHQNAVIPSCCAVATCMLRCVSMHAAVFLSCMPHCFRHAP